MDRSFDFSAVTHPSVFSMRAAEQNSQNAGKSHCSGRSPSNLFLNEK